MSAYQDAAATNYAGVWGQRLGFGTRPALLMIDFMEGYCRQGFPLYAATAAAAAIEAESLLRVAREQGVLVIHTNIRYQPDHFLDGGMWLRKAPVLQGLVAGAAAAECCSKLLPQAHELVFSKQYASAFFGTSLASTLYAAGIDTVLLAGFSTSGCIRASAVDAIQHGFRPMVVRECVADRHAGPHEANLFDIDSKYGDVVSKEAACAYLRDCG